MSSPADECDHIFSTTIETVHDKMAELFLILDGLRNQPFPPHDPSSVFTTFERCTQRKVELSEVMMELARLQKLVADQYSVLHGRS